MARDHDIARPQRPGVLADLGWPSDWQSAAEPDADSWQGLGGIAARLVARVARQRAEALALRADAAAVKESLTAAEAARQRAAMMAEF